MQQPLALAAQDGSNARRPAGHGGSWARLFGYDVFISFALGAPPRGARGYASDLARKLRERGFTVFFSEDEAPVGGGLDNTLRRALHRSRVLVVVANRGTLAEPRWVRTEVEEFRRRHPSRAVVPVSIDGALQDPALAADADAWLGFSGRIWIDETREAGASGVVSDEVIDRLATAPRAVRSAVRLRAVVVALLAFFAGLAAYAFVQRGVAIDSAAEALVQRDAAVKAQGEATAQATRADREAQAAREAADAAEKARAEEQTQRELAEQRLRTAQSRQRAAEGAAELPRRADRALALGAQAAGYEPTFEAWQTMIAASARLSPELVTTLNGHGTAISAMVLSANGQRLFTAGVEGLVVAWDLQGRRLLRTFHAGPLNALTALAVRPDGRQLAAGSFDAEVIAWDVDSGRRVGSPWPTGFPVAELAYSPDGQWLHVAAPPRNYYVLSSRDLSDATPSPHGRELLAASRPKIEGRTGGPGLFDLRIGERRIQLRYDHQSLGQAVDYAVTPDGSVAALAHGKELGTRWLLAGVRSGSTLSEAQVLRHVAARDTELSSVAVSADGRDIATGAKDGSIRMHGPDGRTLNMLTGHTDAVRALAFTPDGRTLISAGADGAVMLWNADLGARRRPLVPKPGTPAAAAMRAERLRDLDAWQRAGADWRLPLPDLGAATVHARFSAPVGDDNNDQAVSADDRFVAVATIGRLEVVPLAAAASRGTARGWQRTLPAGTSIDKLDVASGGQRAAWIDSNGRFHLVAAGRAAPLVATGETAPKPGREHDPPFSWTRLRFSADGRRVALLTDAALQVYDAGTGQRLVHWPAADWVAPRALAIAPHGDALAIVAGDEVLHWRAPFGTRPDTAQRLQLQLRTKVGQLDFDATGERVYLTTQQQFTLWQPGSGQRLDVKELNRGGRLSGDGQWLVRSRAADPLGPQALAERACAVTHDWLAGDAAKRLSPNTSERPPAMPACRAAAPPGARSPQRPQPAS